MAKRNAPSDDEKPSEPPKESAPEADPPAHVWPMVDRDQLADLLGVHADSISDYTREGMPVVERGGRGVKSVYDAVHCLAWWRLHKTEINREKRAQAMAFESTYEFNQIKIAERRRLLVSIEESIRAGQAQVAGWTAQIRSMARRMVIAGAIAPDQEKAVERFCREVLLEISAWETVADALATAAKRDAETAA